VIAYRHTAVGERGLFCGMGVCGECSMVIDGHAGQLASMSPMQDGMHVERQPVAPAVDVAADAGVDVLLVDERAGLGGQYYKQPPGSFALELSRLDHQYWPGGP
jgi:hypothetical protein